MSQFNEHIFGPMDLPEGVSIDLPDNMPLTRGSETMETLSEYECADDNGNDAFREETDSLDADAPDYKESQENRLATASRFSRYICLSRRRQRI